MSLLNLEGEESFKIKFCNLGSVFVIDCNVGLIACCVGVFPVVVSHSPASSAPKLVLF